MRQPNDTGDDIELAVTNDGVISEEALPRIFEPFQQGYAKRRSSGLGLGLYIVDQIVLAHGGTVAVRTGDGSTTFTVRIAKRGVTPVPVDPPR